MMRRRLTMETSSFFLQMRKEYDTIQPIWKLPPGRVMRKHS